MAEKVKPEDAERVKKLIKNLKDVTELYEWLIHTKKQIARVENLGGASDLLEVVIGDNIVDETMRRHFMRGNKKNEGLNALYKYFESEQVQERLKKLERAYVQRDKINNNKIPLIEYVERKKVLVLSTNKSFRDDEVNNFKDIFLLIKADMSAEDVEMLGVMTKYNDMDEFIDACETYTEFQMAKKEEQMMVASLKVGEEKKEEKKEDTVAFSQPKSAPIKDLDKASIDNLMKRPIEEVTNRWKKEMDKQTTKFYESGEKLKHFELIFNKNFENVNKIIM